MNLKDAFRQFSLDRLRQLPPRERMMLLVAVGAAVLLLYLTLWLPWQRDLSRLRVAVPQQKVQLAQMRVQAMEINQLRASGRMPLSGGNRVANLEQSATTSGTRARITRMEPDGTSCARLSLDGVDFNALIGWVAQLPKHGGVGAE